MAQFPNFHQQVIRSGKSIKERATVLGLTTRQVFNWQTKGPPKRLQKMSPAVLRAIADDLEAADAEALAAQKTVPADQPTTPDSVGEGA